ncbi:MAG TPA: EF-hand domain-containing protein [Burkholderiales bacterium]
MPFPASVLRCALLVAVCGSAAAADGALSRAELERRSPRLARHFDAIDADGDGRVTAAEIRAWRRSDRSRGDREAGRRAGFDHLFRRADADGDGALSRDEARRGLPRLARKFERVDADGDGRITIEEAHAWLDARRGAVRRAASAK